MEKILIWSIIKNMVTIICFTVLAIVFNKWWIVFFSALFLNYYNGKHIETESEINSGETHQNL